MKADDMPLLASGLAFTSMMCFFVGLLLYSRDKAIRQKFMDKVKQDVRGTVLPEVIAPQSTTPRGVKAYLLKLFSSIGSRIGPKDAGEMRRRHLDFLRAGVRRENTLAVFWGAKCLLALQLGIGFFLLKTAAFQLMSTPATTLLCLTGTFIGFYAPDIWLKIRISRRKAEISEGLPDALDLMVVSVEAGMGLDAAIHRVAEDIRLSSRVLSDELRTLNLELRAGKARRDALRNLSLRTDLEDVNALITLLIQTDKFGTSVSQALRVYSDIFRTKRQQRAEELAAKLPVKLIIPLILFIFPSIFVTIMGPAAIRIFRHIIQG